MRYMLLVFLLWGCSTGSPATDRVYEHSGNVYECKTVYILGEGYKRVCIK